MFRLTNAVADDMSERPACTHPTVTRFAALMAGGADFSLSAAQGRLTYTRVSARGRTKENR